MNSFCKAIDGKQRIKIIAEIKRASPSHGKFPSRAAHELVLAYEKGNAAALSVVTESRRFGGSLELLREVCTRTRLPVLRKDFISNTRQLEETRAAGAAAVLLIAADLKTTTLEKLANQAHGLGLAPVVEIHTKSDLKKCARLTNCIFGINNRNLRTLKIDPLHARKLLPSIPAQTPVIIESGFTQTHQLEMYRGIANAALIGTRFLTDADPENAVRQFNTGYFGIYGGRFVPEILSAPLSQVSRAFEKFCADDTQQKNLRRLLKTFAGRPTPLFFCENISRRIGARLYLKREDLVHGGAHKTNNTVGQGLLARYMGKKEIIAETGAGQHGVAVAMVGALLKLQTTIFMGAKDVVRQRMNVQRMQLFGAKIISVNSGSQTLKDAINEALRYYVSRARTAYYLFGSVGGPHPYPTIVRHFQSVIGTEARAQIVEETGRPPDAVIACVGGGSNAIGIFSAFLADANTRLIGAEARGGATLSHGRPGILHGAYSYLLQNRDGQVLESHSIAPGLDYPAVGPEHSFLCDAKRARYISITDREALRACLLLSKREGILPALESSHALAAALKFAKKNPARTLLVNLSGRGDKDLDAIKNNLKPI